MACSIHHAAPWWRRVGQRPLGQLHDVRLVLPEASRPDQRGAGGEGRRHGVRRGDPGSDRGLDLVEAVGVDEGEQQRVDGGDVTGCGAGGVPGIARARPRPGAGRRHRGRPRRRWSWQRRASPVRGGGGVRGVGVRGEPTSAAEPTGARPAGPVASQAPSWRSVAPSPRCAAIGRRIDHAWSATERSDRPPRPRPARARHPSRPPRTRPPPGEVPPPPRRAPRVASSILHPRPTAPTIDAATVASRVAAGPPCCFARCALRHVVVTLEPHAGRCGHGGVGAQEHGRRSVTSHLAATRRASDHADPAG